MAQGPADEVRKTQKVYVEKRLEGVEPRDAARIAGYSDRTHLHQIERPGGPVDLKLREAMEARGLDEDFLAGEYVEGIKASKLRDAREKDLNAHAQYLKQMGFLMGHGNRREPTVAVQINNSTGGGPQIEDPRRIGDLIQQVTVLLEGIKNELGGREPAALREGDTPVTDPGTLDGVGPTVGGIPETGSGSVA